MLQVAVEAGVHKSTVSRALNPLTQSKVAPAVIARIEEAVKKLNYRTNLLASSLATGRSRLVGVLVPDIANTVFSPILSGASDRLEGWGYSVVVADVGTDPERQLALVSQLISRRIDGLILATASREDPVVAFCVEQHLPAVLVNRTDERRHLSAVASDDAIGMQFAVSHLAELGHTRIGHLAGPQHTSTGYLRYKGFCEAMDFHGLSSSPPPHETAESYSREEGARATRLLLDKHPELTALVAANDLLALGAYSVAAERGLSIPQDISIVGHNDMPLVDMVAPPLTTIRISHKEIGREAADLLLQQVEGGNTSVRNIVLVPSLVVRGSTGKPRRPADHAKAGKVSKRNVALITK